MITNIFELRPCYGDVDQMEYVYHANYATYCHQAGNELLRKLGINKIKIKLKNKHIILPVISFENIYKKPAHYDQLITIKITIREVTKVRLSFELKIKNGQNTLLSKAKSTVVFVDSQSHLPKSVPNFIENTLKTKFKNSIT